MATDYSEGPCKAETYDLFVGSIDRVSGTYQAGDIVLKKPIVGCRKVSLVSANIPNTAYVFENALFVFEEIAGGGPINVIITGSYSATELATHLQIRLTASTLHAYTYTVVYDINTGLMTFTETGGNAWAVRASAMNARRRYQMGFNATDVLSVAGVVVTPNIVDVSPCKYCLLTFFSTNVGGHVHTSGDDACGHFLIPLGKASFSMCEHYQESQYHSWMRIVKGQSVGVLSYRLIDAETRAPLNLQANWCLHFRCD
jgi:hypothetical protein